MSRVDVSSAPRGQLRAVEDRRIAPQRQCSARKRPSQGVHNALDEQERPHRRPEPHLLGCSGDRAGTAVDYWDLQRVARMVSLKQVAEVFDHDDDGKLAVA